MEQRISIGVDLGTTTSEIVISKLYFATYLGNSMLPVTKMEEVVILYESPIYFTPFTDENLIDIYLIKQYIEEAFEIAGITKESIDTGAVIITGETARRENAELVGTVLSEYLGDFVVATAGPQLESLLAGLGAGIPLLSKQVHRKIMNLDIGGGTCNASVFAYGEAQEMVALDIGGRLVKFDSTGVVTYISTRIQF